MSEQKSRQGRREAARQPSALSRYWDQYKGWLAGLSRKERIRYRVLQTATVISLVIIAVFLAVRAWVRVPDVDDGGRLPGGDLSGGISASGTADPNTPTTGRRDGVYTFLLVGKDVASNSTDTMILLTYDTNEKTIHGLNLPRDTMINVSTTGKRLNAVYVYNRGKDKATQVEKGMAALKQEVAKLTGITPNFYVMVEWEAIGELVDALGGVEFNVPFDMDYDDPYQDPPLHIHQKAGLRLLNGDDAMEIVRFRKSNDGSVQLGDTGRMAVQQDFLKAVAKKCLQPAIFLKIPDLVKIFAENVTTDLTVGNILAFAELAYGMDPDEDVSFATAPIGASVNYKGAAMVTLDEAKLLELLNTSMNPYHQAIEADDLQLVYRKSNGSFGVTNGELADAQMGKVPEHKPEPEPDPEPVEDPEDPAAPEDGQGEGEDPGQSGDEPQDGDTSQEGSQDPGEPEPTPPDGSQQPSGEGEEPPSQDIGPAQGDEPIGTIDPEQVLPDPDETVSQDIRSRARQERNTVAVLPTRPEPVERAA